MPPWLPLLGVCLSLRQKDESFCWYADNTELRTYWLISKEWITADQEKIKTILSNYTTVVWWQTDEGRGFIKKAAISERKMVTERKVLYSSFLMRNTNFEQEYRRIRHIIRLGQIQQSTAMALTSKGLVITLTLIYDLEAIKLVWRSM